jgi:hypothetical protein
LKNKKRRVNRVAFKPVYYLQTDPRWSGDDYSAAGEFTTIGKSGCGPSCMAMIIATLKDAKVTPRETSAWALRNGYKAPKQGTFYTYFVPQGKVYGLDVSRVNTADLRHMTFAGSKPHHEAALKAVKDGDFVIACMGPGLWTKGGHYILWYGVDGSDVLINDPGSAAAHRAKAPLGVLQKEVKYYWIVKNTGKQEEPMGKVFKDVDDSRWSAKFIEAAKELGLMKGDDKGNFNPTANITREEMAVVAVRIYEKITGKQVT